MTNCIEEFKKIIIDHDNMKNNSLNDAIINKLNKILFESLGEILINIVDIDEELKDVGFTTKFNVYNYLFSKDIYTSLKNKLSVTSNDYYKGIAYGGVMCELVKINLYENFALGLNLLSVKDKIIIDVLKDTINEQKLESKLLINTIYNDINTNYPNDEVRGFIKELLESNNYVI